ncbi:TsaE protein, required for threonylcarbamoyladenosine t(6)A37 formation in tRNA [hydrothermal vent metagenome]|uniref:tRNA threonylcarbamoyladenosine biosynthesis protein TsaE n=1 Tax=hydrothermal vent metagenome TaxID=652676 RepID=A0A1W1BIE0_9ZZZZ
MKTITASLNQLEKVVTHINQTIPKNAIIFLTGNLASGKTTLTKAIAKSKGIKGEVTSPTFSLQQCYGDNFYHYDLYRIENEEFMQLALFEEFDKEGWHIIEWGGDELKNLLVNVGYIVFTVTITPYKDGRKYIIERDA